MMDHIKHTKLFSEFKCANRFTTILQFFINIIYMYEVEQSLQYSMSESLPLLRHCRSRLPEIYFKNRKRLHVRKQLAGHKDALFLLL